MNSDIKNLRGIIPPMITPLLDVDKLDIAGTERLVEHIIVVRLAQKAAECGAAALVSAAPYYFAPSQQELIDYYTVLSNALPLPLYLYNMPSHVKVMIEPETVKILAAQPNIIGLKDSSANIVNFQSLMHIMGDNQDFSLFVGPEELTAECTIMGAAGGVNGGANMFLKLYVDLYNAAKNNDMKSMD